MSLMAEQTVRTDLSDLVRRRRAELGLALRPFADRCIDPDTGTVPFKYAWVSKVEKADPTVVAPPRSWLRALAAGLSVPVPLVRQAAAAQFFDLEPDAIWSSDHSTKITVARMSELSESDRAELAQMVEMYAKRMKAHDLKPDAQ